MRMSKAISIAAIAFADWSMIPKSGNRFSDKIMLNQMDKAGF
jgi:hypothetical protein